MSTYHLKAKKVGKKIVSNLKMGGINPFGEEISLTNYYIEKNHQPFFIICGEFHFSRSDVRFWEDEIVKMKMCGVNTIATYVIWNHHEEEEGFFDWAGSKNLRLFIEICKKHKLYFILRIGPFAHGEARNGGLPDWLYGRPFRVRSNDKGYLDYAKRLYSEIGKQVAGLMYKDGGNIIAVQLENEFQAAGAPWETTPIQVLEWVGSTGGKKHMRILKDMAIEAGIVAPIYTSTGWGGAPILDDEVLPLYGGYAFWPWLFYGDVTEHPTTKEFLFQDFHNDDSVCNDFNPPYKKTHYPFACCEMGGGMQVWYNYRFTVPAESVEAMAIMKVAGGCNFIGYYMFHGGSNPIGKKSYLNERTTPKISYDFQAPLGEFGQIRESYKRLKLLHYFLNEYEKDFSKMATVLPKGSDLISEKDINTLRFAIRVKEDSGFLFLNNYQDHLEMRDHKHFRINLQLDKEELIIPETFDMELKKDVSCILPFNMKLDKLLLKYATTQFISSVNSKEVKYYFFYTPTGMRGQYCFDDSNIEKIEIDNGIVNKKDGRFYANISEKEMSIIEITSSEKIKKVICTLTRKQSLNFWKTNLWGEKRVILTEENVIVTENSIELLSIGKKQVNFSIFPGVEETLSTNGRASEKVININMFQNHVINLENKEINYEIQKIDETRIIINFKEDSFGEAKEVFLKIDYIGDVGYAFIDGKLINDNFNNGTTWEIGLKKFEKELIEKGMYLYITPLKKGGIVKRDSSMAALQEVGVEEIVEITSVKIVTENSIKVIRS